jgi:hypothetical protein
VDENSGKTVAIRRIIVNQSDAEQLSKTEEATATNA